MYFQNKVLNQSLTNTALWRLIASKFETFVLDNDNVYALKEKPALTTRVTQK